MTRLIQDVEDIRAAGGGGGGGGEGDLAKPATGTETTAAVGASLPADAAVNPHSQLHKLEQRIDKLEAVVQVTSSIVRVSV